jgi:hypothetical protein
MNTIEVKISVGELLDKFSILEIKKHNITNPEKLKYIEDEFNKLSIQASIFFSDENLKNIYDELLQINKELWVIEDLIRIKESKFEFDQEFIDLARNVYKKNDKRYNLKNLINIKTNSEIKEQKGYTYE